MALTYRVLCFGHNLMLLKTRQWILEKRFLSVYVSSLSDLREWRREADSICSSSAILCRGLTFAKRLSSYTTYVLG
jgi:hypothetical protein